MGDAYKHGKGRHCFLILTLLVFFATIVSSDRQLLNAQWTIGTLADPPPDSPACPALSKEHLAKHAVNNLVLVTVVDKLIMQKFGTSWVRNVQDAGITYWFVSALDPWTSKVLGHRNVTDHCFNAPMDRLKYRGSGEGSSNYRWGSSHWTETTWNKVYIIAAVHELGFHVIHADTDVTWFRDPMEYFKNYLNGPVHALFTTDALETRNGKDDRGFEKMTSPHININTGVYFIRYWPEGKDFFKAWFSQKQVGHDQDGLNSCARGREFRGDKSLPSSHGLMNDKERMFAAALHNTTMISFLPVSMFGNAYTYVTGRVHIAVGHPLYEIHWVWSGSTMESKQQTIRDAMKFLDPPEYYSLPYLVTHDMWVPEPFKDFNSTVFDDTEKMIQFHIFAANVQLRQAYFGFIAALALGRVFVVPRFQCFCAKNWYMTQSCRINGETHATFPFNCALSHMMRVKRLLHGFHVDLGSRKGNVTIREHTFLDNPNVPDEVKKSRLVLVPADQPRAENDVGPISPLTLQKEEKLADGNSKLVVPWPLDDEELVAILAPYRHYRIIHLSNATKILGRGFHDPKYGEKFNQEIRKMTTHWCCRSPKDQKDFNATDKVDLRIVPRTMDPTLPALTREGVTEKLFRAEFGIDVHQGKYNNIAYVEL